MKTNLSNVFFLILIIILGLWIVLWFFGVSIPNYDDIKRQSQINNPIFNTERNCTKVIEDCRKLYEPIPDSYCSGEKALISECESFCMGKSVELRNSDLGYKSYECNKDNFLICNC